MADNMNGFISKMRGFKTKPPTGEAYTQYPALQACQGMEECGTLAAGDMASLRSYGEFVVAATEGYEAYQHIASGSGDLYAEGNEAAAAQFVELKEVRR